MEDFFRRVWGNLAGRLTGPMQFRLFLQPAMAAMFAIRDAIRDARNGEPGYFWCLLKEPDRRSHRLRSGWKAIWRVFTLAIVMDVIYQMVELHHFYPGEALLVACALAILPYLLLRGPINRMIQHYSRHRTQMNRTRPRQPPPDLSVRY